jgi:acyl-CoA thioesterase II
VAGSRAGWPSLADLLTLTDLGGDQFSADALFDDPFSLYGGQVAAQALRAAALTVGSDRLAHSLHGYFLRQGVATLPVTYEVLRDRDGRQYSARRVTASQDGKVIFTLAASFHVPEDGPQVQAHELPDVASPDDCEVAALHTRAIDVDYRDTWLSTEPQWPDSEATWPARVWTRVTAPLGDDPHLAACALTYLCDMFSGLFPLLPIPAPIALFSVDHAMWFYRAVNPADWLLVDFVPESVAAGRGTYSGQIFSADGVLVAGLRQESLFRPIAGYLRPGVGRIRRPE